MALSSRARAFSVDNLLKSASYIANDDDRESDLFQLPVAHEHRLEYSKDSDLSNNHNIAIRRTVDKKDEFVEEENSLESTICNRMNFNRNKYLLYPENCVVQNNSGAFKDNIEDEEVTEVPKSSFRLNVKDTQVHHTKERQLYSFPFVASSNTIDRNRQTTTSPSRGHFQAPGSMATSCFCHGEVTFCQHPGIISVLDNGGSNRSIIAKLCHADLWSSFHALGTEMIITKSGRRMFPALKVKFCGLDPEKLYYVRLDFLQPDSRKYRYIYHSSRWMVSGSGDIISSQQCHKAAEEPISGQMVCSQIVSFERLKLTNTEPAKPGQVSLVSMQKFQPQFVVEEVREADIGSSSEAEKYVIMFPQTSFMAVTAYQNHRITTLKIASNPFAKGFRESGKDRIPYEPLLHQVSVLRKAEQDYLHIILSPTVLPEYFPRMEPTTTVSIKRNHEDTVIDSCTIPKLLKQMSSDSEKTASESEASNNDADVHSLICSELRSPLIMSSFFHPTRSNYRQQLIQELQHGQPNVSPSMSLYLQSMLHHSAYNSGILAQRSSRPLQDTTRQTTPFTSRDVFIQPPPAHASFQPISVTTTNQQPLSPLMATTPSTSAAVPPFSGTSSVKFNDHKTSMFEHDLRLFPVFCCTKSDLDQLSLVQQPRIRSLNAPMFSSSEQQPMEADVHRRASESPSQSPGAFTPMCCLTDQAKFEESRRYSGCDRHSLSKLYELAPVVPSFECRHLQ